MPIETANYIGELDPLNPSGSDPKSQGDDQIRLTKKAAKQTFPNLDGPVNATPDELNRVVGVTSPIQTQLNTLGTNKYDKTGGTVTGEVNVQPGSGDALVSLSRAAGSNRRVRGRTGTSLRWTADLGDSAAESGGNAGSDFVLSRYSDAGALLDVAMKIARADGALTVPGPMSVGGAAVFSSPVTVPTPSAPAHAANRQWVIDFVASQIGGGNTLFRSTRTANAQLTVAEAGWMIDITSGTFAQTFAAVGALGNGWWCRVRNLGSGEITLTPSGGALIDGLSSFVMYPKECRLIACDGSGLWTMVESPFYAVFTASGNFIAPPGYIGFDGDGWSGGGGGGGCSTGNTNGGGGGQGGSHLPIHVRSYIPGTSYPYVVGAGGPGGAAGTSPTAGTAGGDTSFFGLSAPGGPGGAVGTGAGGGAGAGTAKAILDLTAPGNSTGAGNPAVYSGGGGAAGGGGGSGAGGGSAYGAAGGAGGRGSTTAIALGGVSAFAGNGGNGGSTSIPATAGAVPGGGGGGAGRITGTPAGDGARGEIRLWGVA